MKISGPCGRLLCCLAYEHLFYGEQRKFLPHEGVRVSWDGEPWRVIEVNAIIGQIRLVAEDGRQMTIPKHRFEKQENHWVIVPEM
jgi:cell fate regulator YaaT (PSP1 superfamily)